MNNEYYKRIILSDHLFYKGPRPLMTMSTADIPVLHSAEVVHFHYESWYPYARVNYSENTFQGEQAGVTMKPFKGSSNKLGPLGFCGLRM